MAASVLAALTLSAGAVYVQIKDPVIDHIVQEENDNSNLQKLAHELFDGIGPRLPQPEENDPGRTLGQ